jgi:hypothetical protein
MSIVRANVFATPLRPKSVNLVITSPPYWSLRSYRDGDEHLEGQVGDEPQPIDFLRNLWRAMDSLWDATTDDASVFINLGDKQAGSGCHNNSGVVGKTSIFRETNRAIVEARDTVVSRRDSPDRYLQAAYVRDKSLHLLPHTFALGCIAPEMYREPFDPPTQDWGRLVVVRHPQWICRAEIIWSKPNGMPESAADRVRRNHEVWFHFVKQRRYFYSVDEISEPYAESSINRAQYAAHRHEGRTGTPGETRDADEFQPWEPFPMGKLPGSVWEIPTAQLVIPEEVRKYYRLPKHHAPFPLEWPRKLIMGWSPKEICTVCDKGRHRRRGRICEECGEFRPLQSKACPECGYVRNWKENRQAAVELKAENFSTPGNGTPRVPGKHENQSVMGEYVCDCEEPTAPTRPAVVLDPFSGTGTTAMVARSLGRIGIGIDLSHDYCRFGWWRVNRSGHGSKVEDRVNAERQGRLL